MPTLIGQGAADETVPLDKSARLTASHVAGAKLQVYDGGTHALFFTEKDASTATLLTFIQG